MFVLYGCRNENQVGTIELAVAVTITEVSVGKIVHPITAIGVIDANVEVNA